jgi:hypothetical protein
MVDLGISHSYFSCYKYLESELVRITKVVVFLTTNPTKLVLQFFELFMIFYTFYKFLQNCVTIEDALLYRDPQKDLNRYNQTLGLRINP